MPYFRSVLILVVTLLFLVGSNVAEAMTINYDTKPADMAGMQVTATYIDDTGNTQSEILVWGSLGGDAWGVINDNSEWSLTIEEQTSTWTNMWILISNINLTKISIDGLNGNTVFDTFSYSYGSNGSYLGYAFSINANEIEVEDGQLTSGTEINPWSISVAFEGILINASYSNPVTIGGGSNQDLYSTLELNFKDLQGNEIFYNNDLYDELFFYADTDTINPVPEPGTLLLLGAGLLGLSAAVRRR